MRATEQPPFFAPQMEPIRCELSLKVLTFYQRFLDRQGEDPVIRREAAHAYWRVAGIHAGLGQDQDAEMAYRKAIELFDRLGPSESDTPAFLRDMIHFHTEFGVQLRDNGKREESMQHIRRAAEIADRLDKDVPDNRYIIVRARNSLAYPLIYERPEEAEKMLKENLRLAGDAESLAGIHHGLGLVYMTTQRFPQAEKAFRQAVRYGEQWAKEQPHFTWVLPWPANYRRLLAGAISANQRPEEAEELQRGAVLILDKIATDYPKGRNFRQGLADALVEHAGILKQLGRMPEAEKAYRRAINLYEKLAEDFPKTPALGQRADELRRELDQFLKAKD